MSRTRALVGSNPRTNILFFSRALSRSAFPIGSSRATLSREPLAPRLPRTIYRVVICCERGVRRKGPNWKRFPLWRASFFACEAFSSKQRSGSCVSCVYVSAKFVPRDVFLYEPGVCRGADGHAEFGSHPSVSVFSPSGEWEVPLVRHGRWRHGGVRVRHMRGIRRWCLCVCGELFGAVISRDAWNHVFHLAIGVSHQTQLSTPCCCLAN